MYGNCVEPKIHRHPCYWRLLFILLNCCKPWNNNNKKGYKNNIKLIVGPTFQVLITNEKILNKELGLGGLSTIQLIRWQYVL
jgi:hypothetical protein